jgi:hypothetical protein
MGSSRKNNIQSSFLNSIFIIKKESLMLIRLLAITLPPFGLTFF